MIKSALLILLVLIFGGIIIAFYYLNTKINALQSSIKKPKKKVTDVPKLNSPIYSITYFSDVVNNESYGDLTKTEIQEVQELCESDSDSEIEDIIEDLNEDEEDDE